MAKLLPNSNKKILNTGERELIKRLVDELDPHIEIFHSEKFYQPSDTDTLVEGEIDIVILDKNRGVLVVEVKSGTIKKDDLGNFYREEDKQKIKDPFHQASVGMHMLINKLKEQTHGVSCPHGFAVMLPNSKLITNEGMQDSLVIFGADEINNYLATNINRLYGALPQPSPKSGQINEKVYQTLHKILMGDFQCIRSLSRDLEDGDFEILRATKAQITSMTMFAQHPRCAFSGGAGTGKTMLALDQSIKKANEGLRVLFTCFNKDLAEIIKKDFNIPKNLTVDNYHQFGKKLMEKHGIVFCKDRELVDAEFWDRKFPKRLTEAILAMKPDEKYDCVFVDEAQDFQISSKENHEESSEATNNWWLNIQFLLKDPNEGPIWIFYDERQSIFERGGIPIELCRPECTFSLSTNMRNPQHIAEHVRQLAKEIDRNMAYDVNRELPKGVIPRERNVENKDKLQTEIRRVVDDWRMYLEKGQDSKIVILSSRETHDVILNSLKGIPVAANAIEWRQGKGVFLTTHGSFKGLEASLIIDIETPSNADRYDPLKLRYVSHSRAKHDLVCIKFLGAWN